MNIILCLDDNNGMMFNNRRQSMDSELRKNIGLLVENNTLRMNSYSYKQFNDEEVKNIIVCDDFMNEAGAEDFCFVENPDDIDDKRITKIIIYKWNRSYPSDKKFLLDISTMNKISEIEFPGSSHEKITREVYEA